MHARVPRPPRENVGPGVGGAQSLVWLAVAVSIIALVVSTSGIVLTLSRNPGPAPTLAAAADSPPPSDDLGNLPSDLPTDDLSSLPPSAPASPVAPDLEALFPKTVGTTTLTVESMK